MNWGPGGFCQGSLGFLTVAGPPGKKACPRTVLLGAVSKLRNASHREQLSSRPFHLHSEGWSQSWVSLDCAQKAFGTRCTSLERSAPVRGSSAVRHTKAKAVH